MTRTDSIRLWGGTPAVSLKPQALQDFDLQLWQKKHEWVQSADPLHGRIMQPTGDFLPSSMNDWLKKKCPVLIDQNTHHESSSPGGDEDSRD